MTLNRRGFLGVLLASLGTLAVDPKALLWRPTPDVSATLVPGGCVTLDRITLEMLREVTRLLGHPEVPSDWTLQKLGHAVNDRGRPRILNHQHVVSMAAPDELDHYGLDCERYVRPAANMLVDRIRHRGGVTACGELPLPLDPMVTASVVRSAQSGLSMRGLWMPSEVTYLAGFRNLRFDMLVGSA